MKTKHHLESLLGEGILGGVYPGAVLLVAQTGKITFLEAVGHRSLKPTVAPMQKDTIFDLASLTKPLAATLAIMKLVDGGVIKLDQTIDILLPCHVPEKKKGISLRMLLSHSAGFPAWESFYLGLEQVPPKKRKKFLRAQLLKMPLIFCPGQEELYSDLGFMMLEWVVEEAAGIPMDLFLDRHFYKPLALKKTFICDLIRPGKFKAGQYAATEACPWRGKVIQGTVHDENAYALGGYSGHAGLFGTAMEVYALVSLLTNHFYDREFKYLKPETVRAFFSRQRHVKDGTWALGWDTPSPGVSSSGRYFSNNSIGHLGFTGTSIWVDLERDITVIFLTNRIHPTRKNEKIRVFRPKLHNAIMKGLGPTQE